MSLFASRVRAEQNETQSSAVEEGFTWGRRCRDGWIGLDTPCPYRFQSPPSKHTWLAAGRRPRQQTLCFAKLALCCCLKIERRKKLSSTVVVGWPGVDRIESREIVGVPYHSCVELPDNNRGQC